MERERGFKSGRREREEKRLGANRGSAEYLLGSSTTLTQRGIALFLLIHSVDKHIRRFDDLFPG